MLQNPNIRNIPANPDLPPVPLSPENEVASSEQSSEIRDLSAGSKDLKQDKQIESFTGVDPDIQKAAQAQLEQANKFDSKLAPPERINEEERARLNLLLNHENMNGNDASDVVEMLTGVGPGSNN